MHKGTEKVIIFIIPHHYPCGPDATCCGPMGQTEEEVKDLKEAIEKEISPHVEVIDITNESDMERYPGVINLYTSMGLQSVPIITLCGEPVSVGNLTPDKAVTAIKEAMNQQHN